MENRFNILTLLKFAISGVLVVAVFIGGAYVIQKHAMPAFEEVRTETYNESRAHVQGIRQDLSRYKLEYEKTESEDQKSSLRQLALRKAATIDTEDLPDDLREWIRELKEEQ